MKRSGYICISFLYEFTAEKVCGWWGGWVSGGRKLLQTKADMNIKTQDVTVITTTFTFQTLCFNSVWLTIGRLNIWTFRALGEQCFSMADSPWLHLYSLAVKVTIHAHVWPWKGILVLAELTCMSLSICHQRAPAKHWIGSRARRQRWTDKVYVYEGCCGR